MRCVRVDGILEFLERVSDGVAVGVLEVVLVRGLGGGAGEGQQSLHRVHRGLQDRHVLLTD